MVVQFAMWGNSLALRIPRAFAAQIEAKPGRTADLSVMGGTLVVTPVESPVYTLDGLLTGMTEENVHGETLALGTVGNEVID